MSKAKELLQQEYGYQERKERQAARESAVLELSGLMSGAPVRREQVRRSEPRASEEPEDKDLEVVKAAIELYERDPERFRQLVLEATDGQPVNFALSGPQRDDAVMSLASAVQQQLANGGGR